VHSRSAHTIASRRLRNGPSSHLLLALLLLFIFSSTALSETLDDYHQRVKASVTALDTLMQTDENESDADFQARTAQTTLLIRGTLPPSETVEWEGTSYKVDNSWVGQELDKIAKLPNANRHEAFRNLTERLNAIDERLGELKEATNASLSKAAASNKLAEILKRPEYAKEAEPNSALVKLWRDLMKWLERLFPKAQPITPGRANLFSQFAQVFVVVLALAVIGYVIWLAAPRLFKRSGVKKKPKPEARIVLGEKLEPDQSASDLLAEAEALARRGELRAAIRKAYIALLVEMGERKLISLAQNKTNRDYLRALRGHAELYSYLQSLTESFERHWYGFAEADENDWIAFRSGYKNVLTQSPQ
jgi:Domain of unknown function (DUF4129)